MKDKLIEKNLPIKEISKFSVKEKSSRHGTISTPHIWWARKPLVASRAAVYASLVSVDENTSISDEMEFLKKLVKWDGEDEMRLIDQSREKILDAYKESPRILDPFSGGGSMPIESLRLGGEVKSVDYNPTAVFLQRAYIESVSKFPISNDSKNKSLDDLDRKNIIKDFKKWSQWVKEEANKELNQIYEDEDGNPIGYYWLREVPCQNPSCDAKIPLATNFWLLKPNNGSKVALKPRYKNSELEFDIEKGEDITGDPGDGTINQAKAECIKCGSVIESSEMKNLGHDGDIEEKLAAVLHDNPDEGKYFKIAGEEERNKAKKAKKLLNEKTENLDFGTSNILPNEPILTPSGGSYSEEEDLFFNFYPVVKYGLTKWSDLFNHRQNLSMISLIEKIHEAKSEIAEDNDEDYAEAIASLISLNIGRMADYNSKMCMLNVHGTPRVSHTFGRTALPMNWDYFEINPFGRKGANWESGTDAIVKTMEKSLQGLGSGEIEIEQNSATNLKYDDNSIDMVITDPPYYDSVPYSYLSDFFYVWLKRAAGEWHEDLFSTPLTPKGDEVMQEISLLRGKNKEEALSDKEIDVKSGEDFEELLNDSFSEIERVLKDEGIATIIFAHKSTEAWETLIRSILSAGLTVTASWPVQTEKSGRLRAQKSATLKSSVYFVCRKVEKDNEAYWEDIESDIKSQIEQSLERFWKSGIRGADFIVSAIGPSVEIFGSYEKVKHYSGEEVTVSEFLEFIEGYVAEYALNKILGDSKVGQLDVKTRFYIVWRWAYDGESIDFDDARKLSQALGLNLSEEIEKRDLFNKSAGELEVKKPHERNDSDLDSISFTDEMIEIIQKSANLWKKGEQEKLEELLTNSGYINDDFFWSTVQAISQIVEEGDKERKMLQGLSSSKHSLSTSSTEEGNESLEDFGDNQ